jgi:hypothetical protein
MPASTVKAKRHKYAVHPGVAMVEKWIESLRTKTTRSLDEWITLIQKQGPKDEAGRRDWLKQEFQLGTITARELAERSVGKGSDEDSPQVYLKAAEGYVGAMFGGAKVGLLPIYDALMDLAHGLGIDVKACPCKTIVPLYRHHVFAQIKPSTRTRIDFGLALRDTPAQGRLLDTGGFAKKDRISHRFEITAIDDIDAEVKRWLQKAYEMDG